ncbi:hypothetical protein BXQ17_01365 [Polaribacter sp. BM10]|uniref:GLPGLI family protein n=1 Tax=Polaribacter sp. BM10 TaxID=1529069 RepID=UPI00098A9185|nr:GLPGLI family protein [Polaribacter sp. BM10]AQS92792.1 hypothetical protein BXQ17_01365 [Polaribacter sp. BM10]
MKLKNIFFTLFFLTNLTALFGQNGMITYKTKRTKIRKTSNHEMTRKITEEVNRSSYVLYFNKEKSFFKKEKNIPLYPFESKFADISTGANKNWYQFNGINKDAMYNTEILSKQYIVNDSSRMKEWEFFNEIKIIDGYTCYKAVNKKLNTRSGNYITNIAWYTTDIPLPYAPIGNGGLPGLILKLEIDNFYYLVDKIILNPKKIKKIPSLKKGKNIDVNEKIRLMRDARKVTID